jgi:cell pole-organizing protein PopZ
MTTKTDYTEQEWAGLVRAPVTAGSYIVIADPSVMAMVSETQGMMQAILAQQAPEAAKGLVAAVVAEIAAMAGRKEKMAPPQVEKGQDPRPQLMANLTQDLAVLDVKSTPDEKAGFCAWLLTVATATAEAGREGGFLGIGAVRVSDQEKAALEELRQAFGLS